jgi:hypothetical protein
LVTRSVTQISTDNPRKKRENNNRKNNELHKASINQNKNKKSSLFFRFKLDFNYQINK